MLATLVTAVTAGLGGEIVRVEVDVAPGLPVCHIVGLPDAAVSEARERVRSAVRHGGYDYPLSRITINLAPAGRRKRGAAYDLAIAIGILLASGQIAERERWALLGELSLGGGVHPVPGILPLVATLARAGFERIIVPAADAPVCAAVRGPTIAPVADLADAARLIAGSGSAGGRRARPSDRGALPAGGPVQPAVHGPELEPADLADVAGHAEARWALEVALTGGHNLLWCGPPGSGKTLLARTVSSLLPPLRDDELAEVALVRSAAGIAVRPGEERRRPVRSPHHTVSYAAMVGGGPDLRPGLVTQAHAGVLFLDELPELPRDVLEALRQPLEDGSVEIARAHGVARFPARLQLIAAMNPCPCGWQGDRDRACTCAPGVPERYRARISGPLLDRIDVRVRTERIEPGALLAPAASEPSAAVAERIASTSAAARDRNGGVPNANLPTRAVLDVLTRDPDGRALLERAAQAGRMSGRAIGRVARVARTVADLDGSDAIRAHHVAGALALRREPYGPEAGG